MPDDLDCYEEEVERRIKMSYNVYPRPKAPIKCHRPPAPAYERKQESEYEYGDEETELTRKIAEAARKAGIVMEDMDIWEQDCIHRKNRQSIKALGTGWIGPG